MQTETKPCFIRLPGRGRVCVTGPDAPAFLQNLLSSDIARAPVYACLLSARGFFLHDMFVTPITDGYRLECEGGARAIDLHKRLSVYKLRARVTLEVEDSFPVYACFTDPGPLPGLRDPRHPDIGWRCYAPPPGMEGDFSLWDEKRLRLGIPDGSRDMNVDETNPIEACLDRFNGLSFEKGCFPGQELSARLRLRGASKRHLYPVTLTQPLAPGATIHLNGKTIGEMRSSCENIGLALLQDEYVSHVPFPL